jgi:hypothetical protein
MEARATMGDGGNGRLEGGSSSRQEACFTMGVGAAMKGV